MPVASKWSMWSVTISARPALIASNRSPSAIQAQPLVPRVVARLEMGVDAVARRAGS